MERPNLTKEQAKKFTEGYNRKANDWNNDVNDKGRSPYRACSWADFGHSAARHAIVQRQFSGELNIELDTITVDQANAIWVRGV